MILHAKITHITYDILLKNKNTKKWIYFYIYMSRQTQKTRRDRMAHLRPQSNATPETKNRKMNFSIYGPNMRLIFCRCQY